MSVAPVTPSAASAASTLAYRGPAARVGPRLARAAAGNLRIALGGGLLFIVATLCYVTLPWTTAYGNPISYLERHEALSRVGGYEGVPPSFGGVVTWFGTDHFGRSILGRCLFGGTISLGVGLAAATISVTLGVFIGLIAGYRGGWIDAVLMRAVDVLYGLPYILLVLLFKIALEPPLRKIMEAREASVVVMFLAIGLVSWLTMARVIRGQVLSLRSTPFIEAARAMGLPGWRIFGLHVLPNLVGPITVYATLTVPSAILQESFLSFLGVGIDQTLPTWGSLANEYKDKVLTLDGSRWWMLTFPCTLLALTLLSLNFLGDGLRDIVDPKREAAKL